MHISHWLALAVERWELSAAVLDEYEELRIALAKECSCDAQEAAKVARSDVGCGTCIGD